MSKIDFEKTFGDTIKKLRIERHLPLREIAKALEIDVSTLAKLEKNSRKPNRPLIEKISLFFDVSGKDLTIAFLSDEIAYHLIDNEDDFASEIFKVAEEKVEYIKSKRNS